MATPTTTQLIDKTKRIKAFGRSLSDFEPLLPAETILLEACRLGKIASIGNGNQPEKVADEIRIRSGLVRFLALGGDDQAPVHERGVSITGAWIEGDLTLSACHCISSLYFGNCKIDGDISAVDATLPGLFFSSTTIKSFSGDRLNTPGGIHFRNGFIATGKVKLLGAKIDGSLSCTGGKFTHETENALDLDGAEIAGDVSLNNSFHAKSTVRLVGAKIGGDLTCFGGKVETNNGASLVGDGAYIAGNVFLSGGFHAIGEVRLIGAEINGDLICSGGTFEFEKGDAISCERAKIGGALIFRYITNLKGAVCFTDAKVNSIIDDRKSWTLAKYVNQDGFHYNRFGGGPTDSASRIAWLKMQDNDYLTKDFLPQPWEQLIKVLREMGHDEDAREVAIEKQRMLYTAGSIKGFLPRLLHNIYGELSSYGYGPIKTIWWIVGVWLVCSFIYWNSDQRGILGPSLPAIHANAEMKARCGNQSGIRLTTWTICKDLPQEYTTFSSLAYSLDLILPLVDLQQDKDWAPIVPERATLELFLLGVLTRMVMWFEILFGWGTSLLLAAVLGNLVKKD